MTTLDEMARQVDPGTADSEERAAKLKLQTPQQLYELWERQHWLSQDIDFGTDREHWAALSDEQKDYLVWLLSSFFIGEERVTTQFSGLVMAYADEAEESYLTTQQVDEARHMQFFDRFYREVVGLDEAEFEGRLARVRAEVNEAFTTLFDQELVEAGKRLIADPADLAAKVDFVTTYHMVIEGTLALTGQHFITDYLERHELLPGFTEGFANVARDEHRHVAYGTWFLQQSAGRDAALADRMRAKLSELIPVAAAVLVPPGVDPGEEYAILDYSSAQVHEFAFTALNRRLKAIGVGLTGEPAPA
jgi:ribonucleoside-diphosphate reductase beta chain